MLARRTARLRATRLEDRWNPAGVDLTAVGATAQLYGAYFSQYGGNPAAATDTFVSVAADHGSTSEHGYNGDSRDFDETSAHAVALSDVPRVAVNGATHLEFLLNVEESRKDPTVSLDELKVYVGPNVPTHLTFPDLRNSDTGEILPRVYDLDAEASSLGVDNWVVLDGASGSRGGDMLLYLPESALAGVPSGYDHVYLYSIFGFHSPADGKAESWSIGANTLPVGPVAGTIDALSLVAQVNLTPPAPPASPEPPPADTGGGDTGGGDGTVWL